MRQSPVKCMYSTLHSAARSLKKKMHRVSAQNESAGNGPRWRLKDMQTVAKFYCLKCRLRDREAAVSFL